MSTSEALDVFRDCYLSDIIYPNSFPERLVALGFVKAAERQSIDEDGRPNSRHLYQRAGTPYGFSFLHLNGGGLSDGALVLPDTPDTRAELLSFVNDQPNLVETTEETRAFLAFAPEDVSWALVQSRFWTSKAVGETGINYSVGPALFEFTDGTKGIALTASRNRSLLDPLTDENLSELTGPGSKLQKLIVTFSEIATSACPDLDKIIWAAEAYGFQGCDDMEPGVTAFSLGGGYGPNASPSDVTNSIHVNCDTEYDFEFALTFSLDERLTADAIQFALFSYLGVTSVNDDGTAPIRLNNKNFIVRHWVTSEIFGNHAFLLQA
ncbi:hypothetical protein L0666_02240 [Octadecabacter sp. CECT 8868]|uniref:hypothetical protein n=1 Tax=Octadecabacter algicola TaxID=2909342 RepID=UPI001F1A8351|nr:hypothetical protein [Octadecabacter algicola]MCF2903794.1 hypothetical protein [Octadecabacter algicola]